MMKNWYLKNIKMIEKIWKKKNRKIKRKVKKMKKEEKCIQDIKKKKEMLPEEYANGIREQNTTNNTLK